MQDPLTAEAFALSPLSARATLPSEADYDAIRDAFLETTRGRWFLNQYARRNRNADTAIVLEAVARIEAGIAAQTPVRPSPDEVIAAIRPLIAEARTAADVAMIRPDTDDRLGAGHRAARIIREISRSLRETGTDPRICNILDAQLLALETLHDHVTTDPRPAMIGEVFDDLVLRIEELASHADHLPRTATTTGAQQLKPEPVETVGANADLVAPAVAMPAMDVPPAPDDDAVAAALKSEQDAAREIEREAARAIAADEAVLDLIAAEMAVPDIDHHEDATADPDDDSAVARDGPAAHAAPPPALAATEAASDETPPLQPSLGAAILAGGLLRPQRGGSDALAPFRRMTQVEKIAFFS